MPCNMGDSYQHSTNESLRYLTASVAHKVISCWWFVPHVGRYFYTLLPFIAVCEAAQFRRDDILNGIIACKYPSNIISSPMCPQRNSFYWFLGVYWCKWVMSLIYYTVLTLTEEKPKLKHRFSLIRTSLKFTVAPQAVFAGKAARQSPIIHVGNAVACLLYGRAPL